MEKKDRNCGKGEMTRLYGIGKIGGSGEMRFASTLSSVSPQGSEIARQNLPQSRLFCEIWLIQ